MDQAQTPQIPQIRQLLLKIPLEYKLPFRSTSHYHACVIKGSTFQKRLVETLSACTAEGGVVYAPVLPGAAEAALIWALAQTHKQPVLWIGDGPTTLELRHQDLRCMLPSSFKDSQLLYYPARESISISDEAVDVDIAGQRIHALQHLKLVRERSTDSGCVVLATCIQALMQKTLTMQSLDQHTETLSLSGHVELEPLIERIVDMAYEIVPAVEERGQASRRGGILDVWPITSDWPVRLEFFGDEVDSIRTFSPATQRSVERVSSIDIPPAREAAYDSVDRPLADLLSHLPPHTTIVWARRERIEEHAEVYAETIAEAGASHLLTPLSELDSTILDQPNVRTIHITEERDEAPELSGLQIEPIHGVFQLPHHVMQPDVMEEMRSRLVAELASKADSGHSVTFFFDTEGTRDHFVEQYLPKRARGKKRSPEIRTEVGRLSEGFTSAVLEVAVVAESDLQGRRKQSGRRYDPWAVNRRAKDNAGPRVSALEDIEINDYVVHIEHGVGRYLGMSEIQFSGRQQEVITIEYAGGTKLHVPVTQAHLLSRYIGVGKREAHLHRLGSKKWNEDRAAAEQAIADLAAQLLETQAARNLLPGHAHPPDNHWQHEFESSFPFRETDDQTTVIARVKEDLQSTRPMDRLICGDAGYGKTEVAMRAAFKAVMGEKQVALLVPTTVLAQQHFATFSSRMNGYPIRIDMLSRFCSPSAQRATKAGLADGSVDIVIGTHGLLQPGIHFKDLGLVIIDEEQRFGVVHKERFKELRRLVDVLTMTATPIPRTLHMSLTGARDMSLLQTPPSERMAIETVVARSNDEVIRRAILRELNREGQVFYLHNRVMSIDIVHGHLKKLVPEARIAVAHGQMPSHDLAEIMRDFVNGEYDILLCTTIIESGVDIPRANTILIDRADRFGIADLYQLRGRVGRSNHKAYAYLLLPHKGSVDSLARERIGAIRKYSSLSAGFKLALRDLELRGAGNLLGTAQSGHIAAIGFDLYCQLLQRTIAELKNGPLPPIIEVEIKLDFIDHSPAGERDECNALIPYTYIDNEKDRLGTYRRLAEISSQEECNALRSELQDRFGPLPAPVLRILQIAELRVVCHAVGIRRIETRSRKLVLTRANGDLVMRNDRFPRLQSDSADDSLAEILALVKEAR